MGDFLLSIRTTVAERCDYLLFFGGLHIHKALVDRVGGDEAYDVSLLFLAQPEDSAEGCGGNAS